MFKVGDKVKMISFEGTKKVGYFPEDGMMRVGDVGQFISQNDKTIRVSYYNEAWDYHPSDFAIVIEHTLKDGSDAVNPSHYQTFSKETWQMMVDIWGVEAFIKHCEMTAFKYRMRAGNKDDALQDLKKADWYECKAKELDERL